MQLGGDLTLRVDSSIVTAAEAGPEHGVHEGILSVDSSRMQDLVTADDRIESAKVEILAPGERARIVNCLDALQPSFKTDGARRVFPGFLGPPSTVGRGSTYRLQGMSIISMAEFPEAQSGLLTARDAIIDMSGPGADYSPFSQLVNIAISFSPAPHITNSDADDAIRRALLTIGEDLAEQCFKASPPAESRTIDVAQADDSLPSIAYLYQVQSQGSMADTFVYGKPAGELVPTLIHPAEIIDGALVSGVYAYSAVKNPTYFHQNNPVMWELIDRHGTDLNFAGIVLTRGHNYTQAEKERSAEYAAKLAAFLGVDGMVLTTEGGGNSVIDTMLACQYLEEAGIATTILHYEEPGPEGRGDPLSFSVSQADAIVSLGSYGTELSLPAMEKVVGGETLRDAETAAAGPLNVSGLQMYCSTSQVGGNLLSGKAF